MALESILLWLVIGAVAGWLAGVIVKGYGFGLFGNIVVGIVGAVLGGWLLSALGVSTGTGLAGIIGTIIAATLGAVILLFLVRLVRRA